MGKLPGGFCCCTVVILAGVIMTIIGGVFLGRYDPNARANGIAAYNTAVDEWEPQSIFFSSAANEFAAFGNFYVKVDTLVNASLTNADMDPVAVETAPDIYTYDRKVAYKNTASPISVSTMTMPSGTAVLRTFEVYDADNNLLFTKVIALGTYRDVAGTKRKNSNSYSCSMGSPTYSGSSQCRLSFAVGSGGICMIVDPDTKQYAGGCSIMSQQAAHAFAYRGDIVDQIVPPRIAEAAYTYYKDPPGYVTWANPPVVIRSSKDPWVVAAVATEGNMVFGGKDEALRVRGIALLATGLSLLGLLLLCAFGLAVLACSDRCCTGLPFSQRPTFAASFSRRYNNSIKVVAFDGRKSMRKVSTAFGRRNDDSMGGATAPYPTGDIPQKQPSMKTPPPMMLEMTGAHQGPMASNPMLSEGDPSNTYPAVPMMPSPAFPPMQPYGGQNAPSNMPGSYGSPYQPQPQPGAPYGSPYHTQPQPQPQPGAPYGAYGAPYPQPVAGGYPVDAYPQMQGGQPRATAL